MPANAWSRNTPPVREGLVARRRKRNRSNMGNLRNSGGRTFFRARRVFRVRGIDEVPVPLRVSNDRPLSLFGIEISTFVVTCLRVISRTTAWPSPTLPATCPLHPTCPGLRTIAPGSSGPHTGACARPCQEQKRLDSSLPLSSTPHNPAAVTARPRRAVSVASGSCPVQSDRPGCRGDRHPTGIGGHRGRPAYGTPPHSSVPARRGRWQRSIVRRGCRGGRPASPPIVADTYRRSASPSRRLPETAFLAAPDPASPPVRGSPPPGTTSARPPPGHTDPCRCRTRPGSRWRGGSPDGQDHTWSCSAAPLFRARRWLGR